MKEKNQLTSTQKRRLQIGVVIALVVFLFIFFFINKKNNTVTVKNPTVYLHDSKLQVFDDTIPLKQFPDKINMHYPYFLVVKPEEKISYVYNLEQKVKEKEVKEILLDYDNGKILFNKGKSTFLNGQYLGVLCENGFIKNDQEILCITKIKPNNVENKLVSVDSKSNKIKDLYLSKNLITDVTVVNGNVYIGEIDLFNHKNYLFINNERIESPNIVSLIYEINKKPYFASFKSELNNNTESWYLIDGSNMAKQIENRIYFYK